MATEHLPQRKQSSKFLNALQRGIFQTPTPSSGEDDETRSLTEKVEALSPAKRPQFLYERLKVAKEVDRKARIVPLLLQTLQDIAVSNELVTGIWEEARACLSSPSIKVRQQTLSLMSQCIRLQQEDLRAGQRAMYFDVIHTYNVTIGELEFLEDALYHLIEDGRNVLDLSDKTEKLLDLLTLWLEVCANHATGLNFQASPCRHQYEKAFYICERVFKCNYSQFEEPVITRFIVSLIKLKTQMSEVIGKVLDVILVILRTHHLIPMTALPRVIEFVCMYGVSKVTENCHERCEEVIISLLSIVNLAPESLSLLVRISSQPPQHGTTDSGPRKSQVFQIRGAYKFYEKLLDKSHGRTDLKVKLSMMKALYCILSALQHQEDGITCSAVDLLAAILSSDLILRLSDEDWKIIWTFLEGLVTQLRPRFRELLQIRKAQQEEAMIHSRHHESTLPKELEDATKRLDVILQHLKMMVRKFQDFCVTTDYPGDLDRCVSFQESLLEVLGDECNEFILKYYEDTFRCMPGRSDWLAKCEIIFRGFVENTIVTKPPQVRARATRLLAKPLPLINPTSDTDRVFNSISGKVEPVNEDYFKRVIMPLLRLLKREQKDLEVCLELIRIAVLLADSERVEWGIAGRDCLFACATPENLGRPTDKVNNGTGHRASTTSFASEVEPREIDIRLDAMKGLVTMFETSLSRDAGELSRKLFVGFVQLARDPLLPTDTRFEALDVLLRLRADSMYSIYITDQLRRRKGKIPVVDIPRDTPPTPRTRPWAANANSSSSRARDTRSPPISSCEPRSRLKTLDFHVAIAEDDYAPENPNILKEISQWPEAIIAICEMTNDWKFYYHLIEHLPDQLANKSFFAACSAVIIRLCALLSQQLIKSEIPDWKAYDNAKRVEVTLRLQKILTVVIGYHDNIPKTQSDDLVRCFQVNMGRHSTVLTKNCIHALMVCCHELPNSTARRLSAIVQNLSHHITNPSLSVHILEFLVGVGRIPQIHVDFTGDEFSIVFQVAFKYLQHSQALSRERSFQTESAARMSKYIVYLAYETLAVWFLALKLQMRPGYVGWLVRQLALANDERELDEHATVFVDMLERFTYADSPLQKYPDSVETVGLVSYKKDWVVGRAVVTIETVGEDGHVKVTRRKSASMLVTYAQAEIDRDSTAIKTGKKKLTQAELQALPSYMLLQMHATDDPPILLAEDDQTIRGIRALDRMPVVNFHKMGITYVGFGQKTEDEILSNEIGSTEYQNFLNDIGHLVRLKGNSEIYHGGLDVDDDQDGTHAYFWSDKTTQITFITYTKIPLNKEGDRRLALSNKKRNAANCFVNIIWNDSNEEYSLDTIASEFNSNSIVISRHSRSCYDADSIVSNFASPTRPVFKVKLVQMDGMPEVSPIVEEKLVSANSLAQFVRSVALNLSIFCQIYIGREEKSLWVARLDQIKQIRNRAIKKRDSDLLPVPRGALSPSISNATLSAMGRRTTSAEVRPPSGTDFGVPTADDDEMKGLLEKYDFSRYT